MICYVFYKFLHILPPKLFRLFLPRIVPFVNHSKFFWRQGIKLEVLLGFESFQIVAHGFLGCQFLEKCRIFHFGQFYKSKKCIYSGYFVIAEYVISRHISRCTLRIHIVLYGYKLFLTNYVGSKIRKKCEICAIFFFLPFVTRLEKQ